MIEKFLFYFLNDIVPCTGEEYSAVLQVPDDDRKVVFFCCQKTNMPLQRRGISYFSQYQTMIEKLFFVIKNNHTVQRRGISCSPPSTLQVLDDGRKVNFVIKK
jgi:hypothetical protein